MASKWADKWHNQQSSAAAIMADGTDWMRLADGQLVLASAMPDDLGRSMPKGQKRFFDLLSQVPELDYNLLGQGTQPDNEALLATFLQQPLCLSIPDPNSFSYPKLPSYQGAMPVELTNWNEAVKFQLYKELGDLGVDWSKKYISKSLFHAQLFNENIAKSYATKSVGYGIVSAHIPWGVQDQLGLMANGDLALTAKDPLDPALNQLIVALHELGHGVDPDGLHDSVKSGNFINLRLRQEIYADSFAILAVDLSVSEDQLMKWHDFRAVELLAPNSSAAYATCIGIKKALEQRRIWKAAGIQPQLQQLVEAAEECRVKALADEAALKPDDLKNYHQLIDTMVSKDRSKRLGRMKTVDGILSYISSQQTTDTFTAFEDTLIRPALEAIQRSYWTAMDLQDSEAKAAFDQQIHKRFDRLQDFMGGHAGYYFRFSEEKRFDNLKSTVGLMTSRQAKGFEHFLKAQENILRKLRQIEDDAWQKQSDLPQTKAQQWLVRRGKGVAALFQEMTPQRQQEFLTFLEAKSQKKDLADQRSLGIPALLSKLQKVQAHQQRLKSAKPYQPL